MDHLFYSHYKTLESKIRAHSELQLNTQPREEIRPSKVANGKGTSQTDWSLTSHARFFQMFVAVKQLSSFQGDLHRSGGKVGVTDTGTDQQMETTGVSSHSPAGGSGWGSYLQNIAVGGEGGCSWPQGTPSITSISLPSFCDSHAGLHTHSYMQMHTHIQLLSGAVSLWLITVCSPPTDAGSGSGDDGK